MSPTTIRDLIKKHEGCVLEAYEDTKWVLTIGYGHALHKGSKITQIAAESLFEQDYKIAVIDCRVLCEYANIEDLDDFRKGILINMLFNMGYTRVKGFRKMISALRKKDYTEAALEMMDSRWARQVKGRAFELAKMMEEGDPEIPQI